MTTLAATSRPPTPLPSVHVWLREPRVYPVATSRVEMIETHISWVFLTDRHVFKLKKPVRFDFLDFRDVAQRRRACEEEVRLNRRLAEDVYLGVVPITVDGGRLAFDGVGPPVDWVVKMRRLPADRALDHMLRADALAPRDVERVAKTLADFYRQAPPLSVRCEEYRKTISEHVEANHRELSQERHGLSSSALRRAWQAQRYLLRVWPDIFDARVCDGRIVDGHGDLRPEHIYLTTPPAIIDCIEFSGEFRQLDVLDELCFLDMECTRLGSGWVGNLLLAHYQAACGDEPPAALLSFYRCYRACVRAKVAALRAGQLQGSQQETARQEAADYLQLAGGYAQAISPPLLLVVCGLTGSGKSTLAEVVAGELGLEWLQTDAIRRELGSRPGGAEERARGSNEDLLDGQAGGRDYSVDRYAPEQRQRVYDELLSKTDDLLADGLSVLLDGTFADAEQRRRVAGLADRRGATLHFLHCECPASVALQRVAERLSGGDSLSEATPEVYRGQQQTADWNFGDLRHVKVDTTRSIPEMFHDVVAAVRRAARPA
jgi:uncharacterized protein